MLARPLVFAVFLGAFAGPASAQAERQPAPTPGCTNTAEQGNRPPTASLQASSSSIGAAASRTVTVTATATDPDGDALTYTFIRSGGRMSGEGSTRVWDLTGVPPGTYDASVFINDGKGCFTQPRISVEVED